MHELPLTQGLLDLVLSHADRAGGGRVSDVHVVVGELSGVSEDCIRFYWEHLCRSTPAEGARLHFRRVALEFACRDCDALFRGRDGTFACAVCGGHNVRVAAGDGCHLYAIDLEPAAVESGRS